MRREEVSGGRCNFTVGQQVICVDDREETVGPESYRLEKEKRYTVSAIDGDRFFDVAVQVLEIPATYSKDGEEFEVWFAHWRFRPALTAANFTETDEMIKQEIPVYAG